jgi:hypothetical protein
MAADVSMREKKNNNNNNIFLLPFSKIYIKWQLINYIHYQYMHELK